MECIIKGKKQWRWVLTSVQEDTFENGDEVIINTKGKKESDLLDEPEEVIETDLEFLNQDLFEGIEEFEQF
jgi:hypothetical protein